VQMPDSEQAVCVLAVQMSGSVKWRAQWNFALNIL
jgi:hypothetical protein